METTIKKAVMLEILTTDLLEKIQAYEAAREATGGEQPRAGGKWDTEAQKWIENSLRLSETKTAIERQIVLIRQQLNDLKKLL